MRKPKLTIKEQVENLKGKGIVFTSMSEDEVAVYLTDSTTYYALKAYAKLFLRRGRQVFRSLYRTAD